MRAGRRRVGDHQHHHRPRSDDRLRHSARRRAVDLEFPIALRFQTFSAGENMRTDQFIIKPLKSAAIFAAITLMSVSLAPATTTGNNAQDLNFRLINIERRLDQLQIRVDGIERAFQNQALSNTGSSNVSNQALLELQRLQLSISEQLVTLQKQMLEMKKEIDRQALRDNDQKKDPEKKDAPQQEVKPKIQSKKP